MPTRHPLFSSSSLVAAALAVSACGGAADVDGDDVGGANNEAALVSDDSTDADAGQVRCRVDEDGDGVIRIDEMTSHTLTTTDECGLLEGFIADLPVRWPSTFSAAPSGGGNRPTVLTTEPLPAWVGKFIRDTGIPKRPYVPTTYDCDDFASDAERALDDRAPGLGTFTAVFCSTLKNGLVDLESPDLLAHAVTDVHIDGKTSWVEPQTGNEFPLDLDGNGKVKAHNGKFSFLDVVVPTETTKDGRRGCTVYVYSDRAAAEAAGVPLD
jgi:hypothetical protein